MLTEKEQKLALMLYYDLYEVAGKFTSLQALFDRLHQDAIFIHEVTELTALLMEQCNALEKDDNSILRDVLPLKLHGVYTRSQIQVAIGTSTLIKKSTSREGCERTTLRGVPTEAMFVDIIKNREEGSNTNYNDFAQSSQKFHWETQNRVSPLSPTGQNISTKRKPCCYLFASKLAQLTIPTAPWATFIWAKSPSKAIKAAAPCKSYGI